MLSNFAGAQQIIEDVQQLSGEFSGAVGGGRGAVAFFSMMKTAFCALFGTQLPDI